MKPILAGPQEALLMELAARPVLLGFDYDGTLTPIVGEPERAVLSENTRRLFARLSELYPCVVISGRARADVSARLGELRLRAVIGNHGIEAEQELTEYVDTVRGWERTLRERLQDLPGVELENKTHTLSVHYRKARPRGAAERKVHDAVSALPGGVRLIPGKCVINVVPDGAPHKGTALVRCARSLALGQALYVGDDATDEDVFALPAAELSVVGVRVGLSRRSLASYYLRDQGELDVLLERLVRLRA